MEYVFGDVIAAIPWIIFYLIRKDLRKEMFTMSLIAAPLAFFDLIYVPTYWKPVTLFNLPVGIEGVIFSFLVGGIAAAAYAEVSHKKLKKIHKYHKKISLLVLAISIPTAYICKFFYSANIAIAMFAALLVGIGVISFIRKDLLKSSIVGGVVFGAIYALALIIWSNLFPATQSWFTFQGLPRIFILNAPLYEIIFGFLFGAYWGNLYELLFGYRFK